MTKYNGWRVNGLICAVWFMLASVCVGADTKIQSLMQLTDAELIKEYETAGLALAGTGMEPTDESVSRVAFLLRMTKLQVAQEEVLRRGPAVVPSLIAFLEQEVPKERNKDPASGLVLSFTDDVLKLLVKTGDTRGAPIALRILDGWDGKANKWEQWAANDALEKLTHVCFHKVLPHHGNYDESVEHPDAVNEETFAEFATPARLYKQWMEGEGKHPSTWVWMASQRAHELLASEDLGRVYCAATFLRPEAGYDDAPDTTLARMASILGNTKKQSKRYIYESKGKSVPVELIYNWQQMIADYGPRARPYAATLLRFQESRNYWSGGYANLRKVGGPEIMACLMNALPEVSAEVDKISKSGVTSFQSDDQRGWWLDSQREIRIGIDRWAGRVFDNDADRLAWWVANKDKAPERWLADNLNILAEQADKSVSGAAWFVREVLPDLPLGESENLFIYEHLRKYKSLLLDAPQKRCKNPFRGEWLRQHLHELRYDGNDGCFRLTR